MSVTSVENVIEMFMYSIEDNLMMRNKPYKLQIHFCSMTLYVLGSLRDSKVKMLSVFSLT
jgi:hypothetical protein